MAKYGDGADIDTTLEVSGSTFLGDSSSDQLIVKAAAYYKGAESSAGEIFIYADEGDNNNDKWKVSVADSGDLTIESYSGGAWDAEFTLTNAGNISIDGTMTANGGELKVQGGEGGSGVIELFADEGDNNADKWYIRSNASAQTSGHLDVAGSFGVYFDDGSVRPMLVCTDSGVVAYGSTTTGSMIVASRGSSGASELVLAEDPDATYSCNLRYEGSTNTLKLLGDNNGTETTHMSWVRDTCTTNIHGDTSSQYALVVDNDSNSMFSYGMKVQAGTDAGIASIGVRFADGDGTTVGTISWAGGTVNYGTFTGNHIASIPDASHTPNELQPYAYGTIVKLLGTFQGGKERQSEYSVAPTTTAKDKAAWGIYSMNMTDTEEDNNKNHAIFCVGDGHVLVCSEGGNIEVGDYICSSNTEGYGMKQDDDLLHNYTVAKTCEPVDWDTESSTTKLVACTYHAG